MTDKLRFFWIKSNGEVEEVSKERAHELRWIPEAQRIAQRGSPKHKVVVADFSSISFRDCREIPWAALDKIRSMLLAGKGVE